MSSRSAVVADVGGTNVRFALARREKGRIALDGFLAVPAHGSTFADCLRRFLDTVDVQPAMLSVGAAGPVEDGRIELLNSGWVIDSNDIRGAFAFDAVHLFNDFAAMARSAPELGDGDLETLHASPAQSNAPIVVGGPGTGFGLALLAPAEDGWRVVSGEGGHRTFAPRTAFEWEVHHALRHSYDDVSAEVVAGGKHVGAVYKAVCEVMGDGPCEIDPHSIVGLAASGDVLCSAVCQLRANTTMTVLGDTALLAGAARGGVFVAGGESVRLRDYMASEEALARFYRRGPRTEYLSKTPLNLITSGEAGLIGAAALVL